MNRKSLAYLLPGLAILSILLAFFQPTSEQLPRRPISTLVSDARSGMIAKIDLNGIVKVTNADGSRYEAQKEAEISIYTILRENGVDPSTIEIEASAFDAQHGLGLTIQFLPLIFISAAIYYWLRARHVTP